jgi:hypothetical protein
MKMLSHFFDDRPISAALAWIAWGYLVLCLIDSLLTYECGGFPMPINIFGGLLK